MAGRPRDAASRAAPPRRDAATECDELALAIDRAAGARGVAGNRLQHYADSPEALDAMLEAIGRAQRWVHLENYIIRDDRIGARFADALVERAGAGVAVRVLYDALGSFGTSRTYWRRLAQGGVAVRAFHPIFSWSVSRLLSRDHRKLLVVDGKVAFMGSQNMIDSSYLLPKNLKVGRHWKDLNIKISGEIIMELEAVFAMDWYTETGERLATEVEFVTDPDVAAVPMQLLPSGPGYLTIPNLRLFTGLVHRAQQKLSLTSPYFVPDDSLLEAITTAAYRGVAVELFVSEQADQFVVQHAQASYYDVLLEAGVRIYLYPKPTVLHAKHFTVDDMVGIIGSSNMDYRSFGLDYEITLMSTGQQFVADLQAVADGYREVCRELILAEWRQRPKGQRYVDNVMRLVSALQ